MDHFSYRAAGAQSALFCDNVPAEELAAAHGTPLYVLCARTIRHHVAALRAAFAAADPPALLCYSVKANSNLSVLRLLAELGTGFDVVSGGELARVVEAGGDPRRVVYAGVGKTEPEIDAALACGILLFNVESPSELHRIDRCARARGVRAAVALRLNPDVDPRTHRYITTGKRENKFGIDLTRAQEVLAEAVRLPGVVVEGLHVHLGSQIKSTEPFVAAVRRVRGFLAEAGPAGRTVRHLDIGGGFGAHYHPGEALPASAFAAVILPELEGSGLGLILEPGRFIVGNAGLLLTRVVTVKQASGGRRFLICDAGMNDLVRPALYGSYHRIWPVRGTPPPADLDAGVTGSEGPGSTDVVGPICETGDFLGLGRALPDAIAEGDLLAVFSAGAYGQAMASNYNTRARPAEVLVDGDSVRLVRRRETLADLLRTEREIS